MSINLWLFITALISTIIWMSVNGAMAYFIDRAIPRIAKKSALIAALLSLIPILSLIYLIYLFFTSKRRLIES